MGAAGSADVLKELITFMSHPVFDIRLDAYAACTMGYSLMFVDPLLEARTKHLSTERGMIQNSLSNLLEPEASLICEPIGVSSSEYEEIVRNKVKEIEAEVGRDIPVLRGQALDLKNIIGEIKKLTQNPDIQEYTGILMDDLHRFEAITGWPCQGLFDEDGNALPLSMRATIEAFEQEGHLARFRPAHKYFFGHSIP